MKKIFICGLDRSGTTFLASLLNSIDGSIVVSETPFKFDVLCNKKAQKVKERTNKKYFFPFKFSTYEEAKSSIDKKLFLKVIDPHNYSVLIDHTPKNRLFIKEIFNFYDNAYAVFIFRNNFDVYLSHKSVSWGDRSLYKIILRRYITNLLYLIAKIRFPNLVCKVHYEDLVKEKYYNIENFLNNNGFQFQRIKVNKINLPDFTHEQHKLVGQKGNISRINKTPKNKIEKILKMVSNLNSFLAIIISFILETKLPLFKNK